MINPRHKSRTTFRDKIYNNLQSTTVKKIPRIDSISKVGSNVGMFGNIIIDKSTKLFCYHNGLKWVCIGSGTGETGPTGPTGPTSSGVGTCALVLDNTGNEIQTNSSITSTGNYSVSLGESTNATGQFGIAIGHQAQALEFDSISIGPSCISAGVDSIAMGNDSNAQSRSIAIGNNSIGTSTGVVGEGSIAIGTAAQALHHSAVCIGDSIQSNIAGGLFVKHRDSLAYEPTDTVAVWKGNELLDSGIQYSPTVAFSLPSSSSGNSGSVSGSTSGYEHVAIINNNGLVNGYITVTTNSSGVGTLTLVIGIPGLPFTSLADAMGSGTPQDQTHINVGPYITPNIGASTVRLHVNAVGAGSSVVNYQYSYLLVPAL